MTRREAILSALTVFVAALLLRAVIAPQIVFPKPEDTAYYAGVARNLLEGRGFVTDAMWSYSTEPLVFPKPAFEVWLPLPTLIAVVPMALLGATYQAAQLAFIVIGSIVPVLAWRLAADVALERGVPRDRLHAIALGTGLTCAVYLHLVLFSALTDSTVVFGCLALAAGLLMTRVLRDPQGVRLSDPRLIGIGILLGLGALTRNEVVYLAIIWVALAWTTSGASRAERGRMIGAAAVVALIVFAPWALRNLVVFGSPLPGQAITNAFSVTGFDIFAWNDPPTLSRYLAVGPARLLEMRVDGLWHNLWTVLLLPGFPLSLIGLIALPWQGRDRASRPIVLLAITTFLVTSLVFPVSTTWGTFLHAAVPAHVVLVMSAILGLDAALAWVGRRLGWTRPVAWLAAVLGVSSGFLFSVALLPSFGTGSRETQVYYEELERRLAAAGEPLGPDAPPIISNFPIWVAETGRVRALGLPDEPPADVLDMAGTFGAELLVLTGPDNEHVHWPADLQAGADGAACFTPIDLGEGAWPGGPDHAPDPLADTTVYRIDCPEGST
jgi:hypothetical protein